MSKQAGEYQITGVARALPVRMLAMFGVIKGPGIVRLGKIYTVT